MNVVVGGGGMIGLCSAMLLARDGHEVTVLERDAAPTPDPAVAWDTWERRGVNQVRLPHLFLSRFRATAEAELPELIADLEAAGALRYDIIANVPDEFTGGARPGDEAFSMVTGRRTVVEAVTARRCEATPGVTVRRGCAVAGLVVGAADGSVPHVTGVRLEGGGEIAADIVIDAGGRRSPLPGWLADIGAPPCREEAEDSGFVYYGRHFRSADGQMPVMIGNVRQDYGSVTVLTLPADNGTWSVTVICGGHDTAMRALRDVEAWTRVLRTLPLAAHWIDGEPLHDGVVFMGKIEDRIRDTSPNGSPVVTGLLAVGDAWACTNPSLGRGVSIGAMHATALRDLLRTDATDDPSELATTWGEVTRTTLEPWYRATLHYDRHRLAEVDALIEGRPYDPPDEEWQLARALELTATAHPDNLRAQLSLAMVLQLPDEVFADPVLVERITEQHAAAADEPALGPDRTELLKTVGG